jgi:hypothetical protein
MALHIIKLCVGCDTVEELLAWRREQGEEGRPWILRTRMTPKRAEEVLDGGSLYRVFKGFVLCRQRILALETVGGGAASRCEIILDPDLVLVAPTPRRPFQGWRYLEPREAPEDLKGVEDGGAPPELAKQLRELGAW